MRLLFAALMVTASCSLPGQVQDLAKVPKHLRVEWRVAPDGSYVWSSEHGYQTIEEYPVGWYSWWPCGLYEGQWQEVYLNERVEDGRFVPADQMPVATAECFDDSLTCPQNCVVSP